MPRRVAEPEPGRPADPAPDAAPDSAPAPGAERPEPGPVGAAATAVIETPAIWRDPSPLDPAWASPRRRRRRRWLVLLPVAFALVLLLAVTIAFGGFTERESVYQPVAPGAVIRTGPYEMSFDKVTVERELSFGEVGWTATAIGHGRLLDGVTEPMAPYLSTAMAVQDGPSGLTVEGFVQEVGPVSDSGATPRLFTPGLESQEYRVEFELPAEYRPSGYLRLAIADLSYDDHSFLQVGTKYWAPSGRGGAYYYLPVTVIATAD